MIKEKRVSKLKYVQQHSAGGVVYRLNRDQIKVVIFRPSYKVSKDQWHIPKGWIDQGETAEEAAVREVQEETGVKATVLEALDTVKYKFVWGQEFIDKTVDFYLMEFVSGEPSNVGDETAEAGWFLIEDAVKRLKVSHEQKVMRHAKEVILSRHPELKTQSQNAKRFISGSSK